MISISTPRVSRPGFPWRLGILALLVSAAGCAGVSRPPPVPQAACAEEYRLGPGDQLRIIVFRQEDITGEYIVDGSGKVAIPLLGDIQAGRKSPRELEQEIEGQFQEQDLLRNPQVSVEVLTNRPFSIIGEVNDPGSYPATEGMTVINAVATAGGYTFRADQDFVVLQREGEEYGAEAPDTVCPGDVITVPERFF